MKYVKSKRDIYYDEKTGKDFDRKGFNALKQTVRPGDVVIVKEMDRLGRNKSLIYDEIKWFDQEEVKLVILDIPTTLMFLNQKELEESSWVLEMLNKIMIEVMASIAEQERKKINRRQKEGIQQARKRGVKFGRPPKVHLDDQRTIQIIEKALKKEITVKKASQLLNISRSYFYEVKKKYSSQ